MSLRFDDNEKIKEAKRDTFLSHLLRLGTEEDNHDAAVILKKAGLSGYLDNYEPSLQPFSFNGHWKNENTRYQPEMVFDDIYNQIGGDRAHQYTFLKAVVEQITNLNKHDYSEERFNRYLALLGYEIISSNDPETNGYTLQTIGVSILADQSDYSRFELLADNAAGGSMAFYNEAISTFRNGDYGSSVADCRKFFEAIIIGITKDSNLARAIFSLMNEGFDDGTNKVADQNQACVYWAAHRDRVYRFMRIFTLYNCLCGFGSHINVAPNMNDALWLLRETQSSVFWICERP